MNETERLAVGAIFTLLLFLVPGFLLHTAPEFPGSLSGGLLGIAAACLMVLLLTYPLVKYSPWFKAGITRFVSMRSLLTFHVYAGVVGGLLGILHTGHKYQSSLGIALVTTMLVVVVTGFVGRYYLPKASIGLQEQQSRLATLRSAYDRTAADLERSQSSIDETPPDGGTVLAGVPVLHIVDGIADLEHSIGARRAVRTMFMLWIIAHVVAAIVMYSLLALHVASEIYYGLRWLP